MNLIDDWQVVLRRAWSIRWIAAAAVLSGLEVALPFMQSFVAIPDRMFAIGSGLCTAAAFVSRILAQGESHAEKD